MSVYICEKCGAIENTALGGYWQNHLNYQIPMCSECNTGKWHGQFEKEYWDDYGKEELLRLEAQHNGLMINATEFLQKLERGEIQNEHKDINQKKSNG